MKYFLKFSAVVILFISSTPFVKAQQVDADIYLVEYNIMKGKYVFTEPYNFTHRKGYDNQPYFTPDGEHILFVAYKDTIQSDIYDYNMTDSSTTQLTKTPESEFSPQVLKNGSLSVIRVDANKSQHFYKTDPDGTNEELILSNTDSAAYYDWINENNVAMVILDKSMLLNIYELPSMQFVQLAKNVGRCVKHIPDSDAISWVDKTDTAHWILMKYSLTSGEVNNLAEMPKGVEDYAWTNDGKIICGNNGKLLLYDIDKPDDKWKELADFSKSIGNFYRIVVSAKGNKLAIVGYKGKMP
jgi:Tol biopolymer transport system component